MSILKDSFIQYIIKFLKSKIEAKQDKLVSGTNIKTVNGTSLLGSGNVSIEGGNSTGDVDESRLVWSEEAVSQGTIIDNIMYNAHKNGLAFMNPSCIDVYYSTDNGDTWQDYGLTTTQKIYLVTPVTGNYSLYLGKDSTNKSVNYRLRVDLRIKDADIQFTGKKLYLRWFSNTSSDAYYIDISVLKYENYESNEWTHVGTFHKKNTLTIPLNGVMGYNGAGGVLSLRIEVYRTGTTEPRYNSALTNIAFLYTAYSKGNNFGKTGLPMTIDTSQNAIFPAYIKARKFITNGGKSTQVIKGDGSLEEESNLAVATAIDAEHAQEADYAGVADKADKLTNARTISLSGATVGSASFDGSKDVNINVDSIPQGYIQWAGKNSYETLSPLEATAPLFSTNRFALINPECVTIEYSQDGGNTWIKHPNNSSPSAKTYLFTPEVATVNLALGNKTSNQETTPLDMLRITIDGEVMNRYFRINTFLIYMSNVGSSSPVICSYTRTTWRGDTINSQDYQVGGWPAWNTINLTNPIPFGNSNQTYVTKEISFTFKVQGNVVRPPMVCNIACIANTLYNTDEIYPKTGHLYKFDYLKNATFPARIDPKTTNAQDLGSTSKYWRNIYSNKFITNGGTNQQVVLGNGSLKALSEISPITDADADILLDNHIHSINVNANGNDVNISVIESSKNGNSWETEDNDIPIPLATTTSAGVMSKEDKAKLDGGNIAIEPDSGMPDFIGDFEYSDVDYEAIIDLTTVDWINWVEGGLFVMNAEETWEEDNGDTSYHQCVVTFIYRANGCIPISIVNTNKMTAKMSGMVITINLTEGTGEIRFKQIKLI